MSVFGTDGFLAMYPYSDALWNGEPDRRVNRSPRTPETSYRPTFLSDVLPYKNAPPPMRYDNVPGVDQRRREGGRNAGNDDGSEGCGCC